MSDQELRSTLARLLRQSQSHIGLERALQDLPFDSAGQQIDGFRHTAWEQIEHMRLAAEDLVSYCQDADYEDLGWPEGYWPTTSSPPSEEAWEESLRRLLAATETMARIVEDEDQDLFAAVPTGKKSQHHILRAALILLDHNGYHVGQLVSLRIALGVWPPG